MKKIVLWLMSTLTVLTLLFGYHTSTSSTATAAGGNTSAATPYSGGTSTSASGTAGSTSAAAAAAGSTASSSASAAKASTAATKKTVTGTAADIRYGPVQVQITVANRSITSVSVLEYRTESARTRRSTLKRCPSSSRRR